MKKYKLLLIFVLLILLVLVVFKFLLPKSINNPTEQYISNNPTITIIGSGISGLTVAHELLERGYNVTIYDMTSVAGGKARSYSTSDGFPGEHGFRFFPGFYKHVIDTMSRIPYGNDFVSSNLVNATQGQYAIAPDNQITLDTTVSGALPTSIDEFQRQLSNYFKVQKLGVPAVEQIDFASKLLKVLSSCDDRRNTQYDQISWWDYLNADNKSDAFKTFIANSTSGLVALKPKLASTRTVASITYQLGSNNNFDRLLNGPTNDVWITPWINYLTSLGLNYQPNSFVSSINMDQGTVSSLTVNGQQIQSDYYVSAIPVEQFVNLLNNSPGITDADPSLSNVYNLSTAWMNGIQFFLANPAPTINGHIFWSSSPWQLTGISQDQFWTNPPSNYGVGGIFSIDISDWTTPGLLFGKPANMCTKEEIKSEVLFQIKAGLSPSTASYFDDSNIVSYNLDNDIVFTGDSNNPVLNNEPLFINSINSYQNRPSQSTAIPNLFLAGDYTKTNTDLATMEGACESGRRVANLILDSLNDTSTRAQIWPLSEPLFLIPIKSLDCVAYNSGF